MSLESVKLAPQDTSSLCLGCDWHSIMDSLRTEGTLKHMTISRCIFTEAAQPGFPTSLTTLALNNVSLDLDQVFLAVSPLKYLQVLCFYHGTYNYIPLKHLIQYSPTKLHSALPCLQKLTLSSIIASIACREFAELVQPHGLTVEFRFFCLSVEALIHAAPHWLRMTKQQAVDLGMYSTWKSTHTVK